MGRKRKAGVMLPRHVHAVKWKSGTVAYYWQAHRGTAKAGPRTRLPDDPASQEFWKAIKALQDGPKSVAGRLDDTSSKALIFLHFALQIQAGSRRFLTAVCNAFSSSQTERDAG